MKCCQKCYQELPGSLLSLLFLLFALSVGSALPTHWPHPFQCRECNNKEPLKGSQYVIARPLSCCVFPNWICSPAWVWALVYSIWASGPVSWPSSLNMTVDVFPERQHSCSSPPDSSVARLLWTLFLPCYSMSLLRSWTWWAVLIHAFPDVCRLECCQSSPLDHF